MKFKLVAVFLLSISFLHGSCLQRSSNAACESHVEEMNNNEYDGPFIARLERVDLFGTKTVQCFTYYVNSYTNKKWYLDETLNGSGRTTPNLPTSQTEFVQDGTLDDYLNAQKKLYDKVLAKKDEIIRKSEQTILELQGQLRTMKESN